MLYLILPQTNVDSSETRSLHFPDNVLPLFPFSFTERRCSRCKSWFRPTSAEQRRCRECPEFKTSTAQRLTRVA